jgi:dTDP-4-amino-4,6-dideoxygalactose transaminase
MILFNDFKKHYYAHKNEFDRAVQTVFEGGRFILGEQLRAFEKEFAHHAGVKYCAGVASGTEAIALSLMALGIGDGNEVITTNITAFPTITGIMQALARPVVVDINADDGLIDCTKIEQKITAKTKAIVAVHLYGQCCDMKPLRALARNRRLLLIEDAAQAAGAVYGGKQAGSFGHCGAFSFYPTKNLGAFGDGGAITTGSETLYRKILMLRNYGQSRHFYHDSFGINSRLDELQAAILRVKLGFLDRDNERRNALASRYRNELKTVKCLTCHSYGTPNYHIFVVRHPRRDAMVRYCASKGIPTMVHYPVPINRQKSFPFQKNENFPQSERFVNTIFSIPLYPELDDDQAGQIIEAINGFNG